MAKVKKAYFCRNCGYEAPKWIGRCPSCGEWNTFTEEIIAKRSTASAAAAAHLPQSRPQTIAQIEDQVHKRIDLCNSEVNRVLGGGLVRGSLVLLGGEPGIGKSTLLNAIIGEKIAIVTDKAQTTRNRIVGILTKENYQIVFLDTPGIHDPKTKLGKYMVKTAYSAEKDVDITLMLVDAKIGIRERDREIISKLDKSRLIVAINKADIVSKEILATHKMLLESLGDRAQIYINDNLVDILYINDRLKTSISAKAGDTLTVLCENMGRANFGAKMMRKKGIDGRCLLGGKIHFNWNAYTLPMDNLENVTYSTKKPEEVSCFYRGHFNVDKCADTFLYLDSFTKGFVVINGFNIGRYWEIGPQKSLYVPASILKEGENEIVVFESDGIKNDATVEFFDYPTLG